MHGTSRQALTRLRVRAWPIRQTAVAAVAAWYLARLLLPERQPVFASIAAVVLWAPRTASAPSARSS